MAKAAAKKTTKKSATKKPAKRKPAKKRAGSEADLEEPPAKADLARLAMTGAVDKIFALTFAESDEDDALAYKWLQVAADFGHADAGPSIEDVCELTSMRYDDDQITAGHLQFELAAAYLTGGEGLPRDLARAKQRLIAARDTGFPQTKDDTQLLKQTRKAVDKAALAVLNKFLGDS
jgi:TPR repeat protein